MCGVDLQQWAGQRWVAARHKVPALREQLLLNVCGLPALTEAVEAPAMPLGALLAHRQPPVGWYRPWHRHELQCAAVGRKAGRNLRELEMMPFQQQRRRTQR